MYRLDELRFVQQRSITSAADATTILWSAETVPANTIRRIILASYNPSTGESRYITFKIVTAGGITFSVFGPTSYDSNNGSPLALLEQGNEIFLLPGDYLRIDRPTATAGSSMTLSILFVDLIMPFQKFINPYQRWQKKAGIRNIRGAPAGSGPAGGGGGEGGGEGGALPGPGGEPYL